MPPLKSKQQLAKEQKASNARERQIAKQYLRNGPSIQNLYNAFIHWYNSVPFLGGQPESGNEYITGTVPDAGIKNLAKLQKVSKVAGELNKAVSKGVQTVQKQKVWPKNKTIDVRDRHDFTPDELADDYERRFIEANRHRDFPSYFPVEDKAKWEANEMYGLNNSSKYPSWNPVADFNKMLKKYELGKVYNERIKHTLPLAKKRGTLRTEGAPTVFTEDERPYIYSRYINDVPLIRGTRWGDPQSDYGKLMKKYWFDSKPTEDVFATGPRTYADREHNTILAMNPTFGRDNIYKYSIPHEKTHIYINGRKEKELFGNDTGIGVYEGPVGYVDDNIQIGMYLMRPDEQLARGSQIKNYLGIMDAREITPSQLRYAAENYVKDTGMDNNMTDFFSTIKDYEKAAKWLSLAP